MFVQSCKNLKDDIELFECDDEDMLKKIKENDCHSILFLNIPRFVPNFYLKILSIDIFV